MDNDLLEAISERVHDSWMAEKVRQGFADHVFVDDPNDKESNTTCAECPKRPGYPVHPRDRHHTDMLPYADLAEHIKEYDRATVRAVFAAIADAGHSVVKNEPVDDDAERDTSQHRG